MAEEPIVDPSKPDDQKKDDKPDVTKSRIEDLVAQREAEKARATAAEKKLADLEANAKKTEEERMAKQGEFEQLAKQRETELETERKEKETMKSALDAFETAAKEQMAKKIETVKDDKKRATIEKVLNGKPLAEQSALLDELLETIGASAPSGTGNATPAGDITPGSVDVKKEKFKTLYDKSKTGKLTPLEDREFNSLAKELGDVQQKEQEVERQKTLKTQMDSETQNFFS